jgi:hypothetical protein
VLEKLDDCLGRFIAACSFMSVNDNFEWHLQAYMVLIMIMTGKCLGMNWLEL